MSSTINFGIDLGTTNSAIAVFENGEVKVFKNPRTLKQTIPSVVAFKGDRIIVGEKAAELLVKGSGDIFGGFKRRMGSMDRFEIETSHQFTSPIELSSIILKELKHFLQTDEIPDAVVITIPAAFDTNQSNATKEAGYAAGFEEVILLQEPIAASLAYANRKQSASEDSKWIVYDFGGGTFDVALTGIQDDEMKVLDHEGDNFLGGKDIDRAIVEQFIIPALEKKGTFNSLLSKMRNVDGPYHRLYHKLLYLAEEAKIALSSIPVADIEFDVADESGNQLDVVLQFSQEALAKIAHPFIQQSLVLVDTLLKRNQLSGKEISCILLVGGTTYIPAVRKSLQDSFHIEVDTSIDPITAVVVGAAYFAGLRVKMTSRKAGDQIASKGKDDLQVQTAYERLVRVGETPLMIRSSGNFEKCILRITRKDGGFDSGLIPIAKTNTIQLALLPEVYNEFELIVTDATGKSIFKEKIGITQGKFGIHGQPLPHPIGIEVDDAETNSTFLDILFKKNAILPLRRTITKKVAETIQCGTSNSILINVFEGDIDSIPQANRRIGTIEISGHDLARDLIRGSDIELTIEISESRDVKVSAYLVLTDQHFENTFSPSEIQFNGVQLEQTISNFEKNLLNRRDQFERTGKYEKAGQIQALLNSIEELKVNLLTLNESDGTEEKYMLEIKVREIGRKIHELFSTSYLTKLIETYFEVKGNLERAMLEELPSEMDKSAFTEIKNQERIFLQEGNVGIIKMKTSQLQAMLSRTRGKRSLTEEDVKAIYFHLRNHPYRDRAKADILIEAGDQAVSRADSIKLRMTTETLYGMYLQENGDNDFFMNRKTGLA